ncbi:MAG: hypothetical protein ACRDLK_10810, partial [Gaiellaceae bacterium]
RWTVDLRDESLLRLFFADVLPREEAIGLLDERRRGHEALLGALRVIDARPGRRSAVRRPRPSLGDRVQRVGCPVVRGRGRAPARDDVMQQAVPTIPSFRSVVATGLPGVARTAW